MNETTGNGSNIVLVGLVGSLGSGRADISNFLYYSYGFVKINFKDKVEEVAKILGKTDIRSLQTIKHVIRGCFRDVWIKLLEKRIEEEMASKLIKAYSIPGVDEVKPVLRVVVGDIGYREEFDFVKETNGLLIGLKTNKKTIYERVKRRTEKIPSFEEFKKWLRHPSVIETPSLIKKCDFIIDTNKITLPKVEERVDEIVRRYFLGNLY